MRSTLHRATTRHAATRSSPDFAALLHESPVGFALLSLPEARYVYVNPALAALQGVDAGATLGLTAEEVLGPELPAATRPVVRAALESGEACGEIEVDATITGRAGNRVFLVQVHPIRAAGGATTQVWLVVQDITERRRLERQERRVLEIAQAVNAGKSLAEVLRMVHDAVVSIGVFDRAGIWLYDEDRSGMRGSWGSDREGRTVDESELFMALTPDGDHPLQRMYRGEIAYHLTSAFDWDPHPSEAVSMEGVHAHGTLAVAAHGRVIGLMFVDNLLTDRPITEDDLRAALPFVEQAAIAIDSARLRHVEHERAAALREAARATNHRVKNNLQVVVAIMEALLLDDGNTLDRRHVERASRQIRTLTTVQQHLGECDAEIETPVGEILAQIAAAGGRAFGLEVRLNADEVVLSSKQAIAVALILDELMDNAKQRGATCADVAFRSVQGGNRLTVRDDGAGFPLDQAANAAGSPGLGLTDWLARWDLQGSATFRNLLGGGAEAEIAF